MLFVAVNQRHSWNLIYATFFCCFAAVGSHLLFSFHCFILIVCLFSRPVPFENPISHAYAFGHNTRLPNKRTHACHSTIALNRNNFFSLHFSLCFTRIRRPSSNGSYWILCRLNTYYSQIYNIYMQIELSARSAEIYNKLEWKKKSLYCFIEMKVVYCVHQCTVQNSVNI